MRHESATWASIIPVALVSSLATACSNGAAPPPLDSGVRMTSRSASSSGSSGTDAGCAQNYAPSGPFTYTPMGCGYSVTPPSLLAYTATAPDDDSSAGPASTAAPMRVRLGLGGGTSSCLAGYPDPTTTGAFTWETGAANTAAKVKYGVSASALTTVQSGYVWTLPATAEASAAYMHEAHVCGLTPDTTYYYQVGGGAPGAEIWSATQSFTTLPATGAITLGVYGDARDSATVWTLANEHIKALNVQALLFSGDLILTGAEESEYTSWLDAIWQDPNNTGQFLTLGELMFLPTAGNHEYIFDATADHFYSAFALPGSGMWAKSFGSYDIGIAHIVFLDDTQISMEYSGTDIPQADQQLAWLNADLAAANADRTKHPFIIVMSHRGVFSTSMHSMDTDVLQARTALAPIFAKYKVDLVLNGHDHEYERTVPIVPGNPVTGDPVATKGGTTYVICAGAGATPYDVGDSPVSWRAQKVAFGSAATGTSASYQGVYQTLKLDPTTHTMAVTVYALTGSTPDPVVDSFTLNAQ